MLDSILNFNFLSDETNFKLTLLSLKNRIRNMQMLLSLNTS